MTGGKSGSFILQRRKSTVDGAARKRRTAAFSQRNRENGNFSRSRENLLNLRLP